MVEYDELKELKSEKIKKDMKIEYLVSCLRKNSKKNKTPDDTINLGSKNVYQNFSKNKIIHKEFNILAITFSF